MKLLQQESSTTMSAQKKRSKEVHTFLLSLNLASGVQTKLLPATQREERLRVVVIIALQTAGQGDGAIPTTKNYFFPIPASWC
jgi:hypothetical protein